MLIVLGGCASVDSSGVDNFNPAVKVEAVDGFDFDIWDSTFSDGATGSFQLDISTEGQDRLVSIRVIDADNLKAVFGEVLYDAECFHPTEAAFGSALGDQDERLELHGESQRGRLQLGQVMLNPGLRQGFSGNGELAWVRFSAGRGEPPSGRRASGPPTGETPLLYWDRQNEHTPRWTYGGVGDYDQNGEVNVADLQPIAVNFGKAGAFNPLSLEYVVDGDHNGEINAADITPIAVHFGETVDGYNIYLGKSGSVTSAVRRASLNGLVPYSVQLASDIDLVNGAKQLKVDVLQAESSLFESSVVGITFEHDLYAVLLGGEYGYFAIAPYSGAAEGVPSIWVGGDPALQPIPVWNPSVMGNGTPGYPFQLEPDFEYTLELHDALAQNATDSYRLMVWDVPNPFRFVGGGMQSSSARQTSDSVLFSTAGGIDPPQFTVTSQAFSEDLNTAMFFMYGQDDFTLPDSGWTVELTKPDAEFPSFAFDVTPLPVAVGIALQLDAIRIMLLNPSFDPDNTTFGWDLDGDGQNDALTTSPRIDHSFETPGTQKVTLNVFKGLEPDLTLLGGSSKNIPVFEQFSDNLPPLAVSKASDSTPLPGDTIVLTGEDSSDPDQAAGDRIAVWRWDIVNGNLDHMEMVNRVGMSTEVVFSEEASGEFMFELQVLDLRGGMDTDTVSVTVGSPTLPVVDITYQPEAVYAGARVQVTVTASDADGLDFINIDLDGDGQPDLPVEDGGGLQQVEIVRDHIWTDPGPVSISAAAINIFGREGNDIVQVDVLEDDQPPTIDFSNPLDGGVALKGMPLNIQVTASDNAGIEWMRIDVANDGSFELDQFKPGQPLVADASWEENFGTTGSVEIFAEVLDVNGLTGSDLISIQVTDQPVADLQISTPVTRVGREVEFDASGSSDPDGTIVQYEFDFDGDGSYDQSTDQAVVSHTFAFPFELWSTVRVTDNAGATRTMTKAMTVKGPAVWNTVVADDGGNDEDLVGRYANMTLIAGRPAIAYYDLTSTNKDLKYVRALNARGIDWGNPVEVNQTGAAVDDGHFPVLFETTGNPLIASMNVTNGVVELIHADDANGASWSGLTVIDGGSYIAGQGLAGSLIDGKPALSYYDTTNNRVMYLAAIDDEGSAWMSPQEAATTGSPIQIDSHTQLSTTTDGFPAITSQLAGLASYSYATDMSGTAWAVPAVISTDSGSIAPFGLQTGNPAAFYLNAAANELHFERAANSTGSLWDQAPSTVGAQTATIDLAVLWPEDTASLYVDSYLKFIVTSGAPGTGLTVFTSEDAAGVDWNTGQVVDATAGAGEYGVSMIVTTDGRAAIAWWDPVENNLMYACYDDAF